MKVCPSCNVSKKINKDNYYINKYGKSTTYCKECTKRKHLEKHHETFKNTTERKCKVCGEIFPLNNKYFHYKVKAKNYFMASCKPCRNKEVMARNMRTKEINIKKYKKEIYEKKETIKKQLEKQYKNYVKKGLEEDRKQGLDISQLKLNVGQVYKVKMTDRNRTTTFEGKLIQDTTNHVTLQNKRGIRESFLKVDLLLEHEYKEVN